MLIPDNGKLRYKGVWDYCFKTKCQWFASKCGLAVTPAIRAQAIIEEKEISSLEYCPLFNEPFKEKEDSK